MLKIYLATSWKMENTARLIAEKLRKYGFEVDCFSDESMGRYVFFWDKLPYCGMVTKNARDVLALPEVQRAFEEDRKWMDWADVCILILPSGRSAHLLAGYAVGKGKTLYIIGELPSGKFDVMYGFAERMFRFEEFEQLVSRLIDDDLALAAAAHHAGCGR